MSGESKKQILHPSSTKSQGLSRGIAGCSARGQELCGWATALWEKAVVVLQFHEAKHDPAEKAANSIQGCMSSTTARRSDCLLLLSTFYTTSKIVQV